MLLYQARARRIPFQTERGSWDICRAPAQSRRGLIFFQTPKKEPVEAPRGLVLTIERLPQPLELRLN